ncbi:MAG: cytochrome c family protein [Pseudomonadota bacterium]
MGELTLNTIFGCVLAVVLAMMGLHLLSHSIFAPEKAHYDDHGGEALSLNEKIAASYAYYVEVEDGRAGGGDVVEDVFDLGLALANADPARGESSFKQKCQSCHSIAADGGNGIGPMLWNAVGAPKAAQDGFRYSSALQGHDGAWTYESLNAWLKNPSGYVPGTSMGFAGLNRDSERANVIAYMASQTANPPPFPEPLPAAGDSEAGDVDPAP